MSELARDPRDVDHRHCYIVVNGVCYCAAHSLDRWAKSGGRSRSPEYRLSTSGQCSVGHGGETNRE